MTQENIVIYNADDDEYYFDIAHLEDWIEEDKEDNDGEMPDLSQLFKCLPTKVPLIDTGFEDVFAENIEIPKALLEAAEAYNAIARVTDTHTYYPTKIKYVYE